jgi:uncharacterized protein YdiU (UPF0061 family)
MYTHDIIARLNKSMIRIGNQEYYPVMKVVHEFNSLSDSCVMWSEDDFQQMAIQKTNEEEWDQYYNKDMFSMTLKEMIYKHDASIGITWDTVEYYLDTYCKIKDYHPIGQYK